MSSPPQSRELHQSVPQAEDTVASQSRQPLVDPDPEPISSLPTGKWGRFLEIIKLEMTVAAKVDAVEAVRITVNELQSLCDAGAELKRTREAEKAEKAKENEEYKKGEEGKNGERPEGSDEGEFEG